MSKELNFMPDLPPSERLRLLQENADSFEETVYFRDLKDEEMDVNRETFTGNLIKLSAFDDQLSELKAELKQQSDPLKSENKILLEELKTRKRKVNGPIFHMAHHDSGIMVTYDENGEFISSRRLKPNEKQARLRTVGMVSNG